LFGRTESVQGDWDEISLASVVRHSLECTGPGLGAVPDDALNVIFDPVVVYDPVDDVPDLIVFFDPVVR
jgi:hypothetical protein